MDTSGNIRYLQEDEKPRKNEVLMSAEQAREQSKRSPAKRKNWMRNQPCPCGSGKKLKKCCWTHMTKSQIKDMGILTKDGIKEPW